MQEFVIIQRNDLRDEISAVLDQKLESFFSKFQHPAPNPSTGQLRSRKEAAKRLGISLVTLNEWTKTGIVKGYRINSRVRYKEEDLEACLNQIKSSKQYA